MAQMYSDRVLITFNGVNIFSPGDLASFSVTRTGNASFVQGMTTSGNSSGSVKGNNTAQIRMTMFVQNNANSAPIDFASFDYELNNVTITISPSSKSYGEHTYEGKQLIFTNVFYMEQSYTGAGQGQTLSREFTFGAIEVTEV